MSKIYLLPYQEVAISSWVRETAQQQQGDIRFQALALLTPQESVEAYNVNLFDDGNLLAVHAKQITVMPKDIKLACKIWEDMVKYLPVLIW